LCFLIALWNTVHMACLWATTAQSQLIRIYRTVMTTLSWSHCCVTAPKFSLLEICTKC
jgi:hypothetical protein